MIPEGPRRTSNLDKTRFEKPGKNPSREQLANAELTSLAIQGISKKVDAFRQALYREENPLEGRSIKRTSSGGKADIVAAKAVFSNKAHRTRVLPELAHINTAPAV